VPRSVVVLGGGVIGVEFASVFKSFGADVTIVEALPRLVPGRGRVRVQAPGARLPQAQDRLQDRREVHRGQAERLGVTVSLESGEDSRRTTCSSPSDAAPTPPTRATRRRGEDGARLRLTDDRLRTNLPDVYAVGDIVPGLQLAHRGFQQGIFIAEDIAGLNPPVINEAGHPARHLLRAGGRVRRPHRGAGAGAFGEVQTLTYDLAGNGKSQILQTQGAIKLVKAGGEGTPGPVVGVHMVGARVGELIGEASSSTTGMRRPRTSPRSSTPTPPRRSPRRGPPRPGGQAPARPLLTSRRTPTRSRSHVLLRPDARPR
jgi:dihydrolipoamide dehydrogenase